MLELEEFLCRIAFHNVENCLCSPSWYGFKSWAEMYKTLQDWETEQADDDFWNDVNSSNTPEFLANDVREARAVAEYVLAEYHQLDDETKQNFAKQFSLA